MADLPIVGIGSSAGGLEPLQQLFRAMPPDGGLAFIIAAHLDPTQKSHLTELLGRCTKMPVVQIENSIKVEPNHVYVIAPDQELTIKEGVVRTNKPSAPRGHRHPVDSFFRSLAEDQGERAIAIVLSGTGTNGSLGLRFVKAEGGIAIAQDPETAAFQGMPRSAIGTGVVDLVLPPDKMPEALLGLARHAHMRQPAQAVEETTPDEQLNQLLTIVRTQSKRDFGGYKKQTLLRRIHRRMGLHRVESLPDYIARLRDDPEEVQALAADLTINVTGFFRDPEAWRELDEKVIAPLVQERPTDSTIRVWVPGCSTGEEAYSIAMLVAERGDAAGKSFDLKLFATDVAQSVLSAARAGAYPASIAADMTPDRLQRFFDREDDTFSIKKRLREMITFAPQNLLQDPPFSRIDLISCRNLLIYLRPDIQKKVLALFHFALREDGHLFLGPAETVSARDDLFETVSRKWRIYRRLGPTRHDVVDFPLIGGKDAAGVAEMDARSTRVEPRQRPRDLVDRALLDRYAPACALIDHRHAVHYLRGPTGEYLQPASGEPSHNLMAMAREGLQTPLRSAIRKALQDSQEVTVDARVRRGGAFHPVRIAVAPLRAEHNVDGRLLVSFFERETGPEADVPAPVGETPTEGELQAELEATRNDLQLTIEQMEASNEELKASNEEIRSINEELQASNEELETSKEELQSLNEELNTVNNQLQAKVAELEVRTADLNNLLNSSDVATLFLDRSLCIRWFTPSMKALLELLATDVGRPISHFAQRFRGGDLLEDARKVLERLLPSEVEVVDELGRWYIRRILPYRTGTDRIDGVVVTFNEITDRKRGEQEVQAAREFAESIVDTIREPLLVLTPDLKVRSANDSFYRDFRVSRQETEGRLIYELGNRQWDIPQLRRLLEEVLPHDKQFKDFEVEHEFEGIGRRTMLLNGRRLDHVQLILLAIEDITERKRADAAVRASEERFRQFAENSLDVLWIARPDMGGLEYLSRAYERIWGESRDVTLSDVKHWAELVHPDDRERASQAMPRVLEGEPTTIEYRIVRPADREMRWIRDSGFPIRNEHGAVVRVAGIARDVTEEKRTQAERELLAHELSHRVKNILAVVQSLATQTDGRVRSVEAYRRAFIGRLQAMARAHSVLLDANWQSADLKTLVEQAVEAYRVDHPEMVEIKGVAVAVNPRQGLGVSLVLHELGTNAVKYGALSHSKGRLRVSWEVERASGRQVRLRWQERHGPKVKRLRDKGFGTQLIERACTYELDGEVELDYAPEGLTCTIVFPLE